jgi:hypothetical protein
LFQVDGTEPPERTGESQPKSEVTDQEVSVTSEATPQSTTDLSCTTTVPETLNCPIDAVSSFFFVKLFQVLATLLFLLFFILL